MRDVTDHKKFVLEPDGVTVREADLMEWATFFDSPRRIVIESTIGRWRVVTIFFGCIGIKFETAIWEDVRGDGTTREFQVLAQTETRAEAEAGHAGACDALRDRPPSPPCVHQYVVGFGGDAPGDPCLWCLHRRGSPEEEPSPH